MFRKILGLDINEDLVAGVLVDDGLKSRRVTGAAVVSITACGGLSKALGELLAQLDAEKVTCYNGVPGDRISYRNLVMPFKDRKKIRQTFCFELEALLPFPVEDMVADFCLVDQEPGRSTVLAAVLKSNFLAGYLATLKARNIDPEILDIRNVPLVNCLLRRSDVPDCGLVLDIGCRKGTLLLFRNRKLVLVRKLFFDGEIIVKDMAGNNPGDDPERLRSMETCLEVFCRTVRNTCHISGGGRPEKAFLVGSAMAHPDTADLVGRFLELPVESVDLARQPGLELTGRAVASWNPFLMNNALAVALRDKKQQGFNFRRQQFEYKRWFAGFKKEIMGAAIFLFVIISLLIVDFGIDYFGAKSRYRSLDAGIKEVFIQTLPEVKRIVDPVQQLRVKIDELKKNAFSGPSGGKVRVLDLLEDISNRIPESLEIVVTRMVVDQDGVQIKGKTDTFNTVDNIKKGLESSEYFQNVKISSANLDKKGQGILFEIRIRLVE